MFSFLLYINVALLCVIIVASTRFVPSQKCFSLNFSNNTVKLVNIVTNIATRCEK